MYNNIRTYHRFDYFLLFIAIALEEYSYLEEDKFFEHLGRIEAID